MTTPITKTVLSVMMDQTKKKIVGHKRAGDCSLAVSVFCTSVSLVCGGALAIEWGTLIPMAKMILGATSLIAGGLGFGWFLEYRKQEKHFQSALQSTLCCLDEPDLPKCGKNRQSGDCILNPIHGS